MESNRNDDDDEVLVVGEVLVVEEMEDSSNAEVLVGSIYDDDMVERYTCNDGKPR